mmetsp:Transcript_24652/g.24970  ORF Transcript_24652/g.24970 Transcript_24652/m.24970 type:complete len:93 (-) Transcript_24652:2683-2961(-)
MEQFLRLLINCGMDPKDVDFLNCRGPVAQELIVRTVRMTQFTGSSRVAELLLNATNGKIKIEDGKLLSTTTAQLPSHYGCRQHHLFVIRIYS